MAYGDERQTSCNRAREDGGLPADSPAWFLETSFGTSASAARLPARGGGFGGRGAGIRVRVPGEQAQRMGASTLALITHAPHNSLGTRRTTH